MFVCRNTFTWWWWGLNENIPPLIQHCQNLSPNMFFNLQYVNKGSSGSMDITTLKPVGTQPFHTPLWLSSQDWKTLGRSNYTNHLGTYNTPQFQFWCHVISEPCSMGGDLELHNGRRTELPAGSLHPEHGLTLQTCGPGKALGQKLVALGWLPCWLLCLPGKRLLMKQKMKRSLERNLRGKRQQQMRMTERSCF